MFWNGTVSWNDLSKYFKVSFALVHNNWKAEKDCREIREMAVMWWDCREIRELGKEQDSISPVVVSWPRLHTSNLLLLCEPGCAGLIDPEASQVQRRRKRQVSVPAFWSGAMELTVMSSPPPSAALCIFCPSFCLLWGLGGLPNFLQ